MASHEKADSILAEFWSAASARQIVSYGVTERNRYVNSLFALIVKHLTLPDEDSSIFRNYIVAEPQSNLRLTDRGFLYPLVRSEKTNAIWFVRKGIVSSLETTAAFKLGAEPLVPFWIVLLCNIQEGSASSEEQIQGWVLDRIDGPPLKKRPLTQHSDYVISHNNDFHAKSSMKPVDKIMDVIARAKKIPTRENIEKAMSN